MKLEREMCGGKWAWGSLSGMETEADRHIQLTALIEERETLQRELARCRNPVCTQRRKKIEFQPSLIQRRINIRMRP